MSLMNVAIQNLRHLLLPLREPRSRRRRRAPVATAYGSQTGTLSKSPRRFAALCLYIHAILTMIRVFIVSRYFNTQRANAARAVLRTAPNSCSIYSTRLSAVPPCLSLTCPHLGCVWTPVGPFLPRPIYMFSPSGSAYLDILIS